MLPFQMIETGDGAAAYYGDVMQAAVSLALAAPGGPPANAAAFLDRLDAHWLETAYGDGLHDAAVARIRAAKPHLGDIQLRYATLLGRLGPALDGPGTLADADVWYFILEGTREQSVAEAQAMALTELVATPPPRPAPNGAPSCWALMTIRPCPAGCRCPTCTNAAGRSGSASWCPPSRGRASALMMMSGTGSPRPLTAGSG